MAFLGTWNIVNFENSEKVCCMIIFFRIREEGGKSSLSDR